MQKNMGVILVLGIVFVYLAPPAFAQDKQTLLDMNLSAEQIKSFVLAQTAYEVAFEQGHQRDLKDYRAVKQAEDFAPRPKATKTFRVRTKPSQAVATLHDFRTGGPLQSCVTPCELDIEGQKNYGLGFYKFGHMPRFYKFKHKFFQDHADGKKAVPLGIGIMAGFEKGAKCHADFEKDFPSKDQKAKPCFRSQAMMPYGTKKSAFCKVHYDVTQYGWPINIVAGECSEPKFKAPSEAIVHTWSFTPKVKGGQAVMQEGLTTKVTYKIERR